MGDTESYSIVYDMGLTYEEFMHSLPAAVVGMELRVEGSRIHVGGVTRRIEIRLGPEQRRRLGSLVLPRTRVSLVFEGFSAEERKGFLTRFDRAFQRGGG